ncbi:adenosylcobinamide-GDP ribazoletransferase [Pseudooceanicola algae]|uniref:Adenosylcobinamide-GDP ribazoletransferase n=1 Tax=Pseudooceanicola algae TaxID=1537215 RepID=A0A418SCE8_9RHOB|nr:adenosylcobinamide-GDP ribazoletransferase [Pseudooceanicola algae]QPM90049.1 Adenosylcobinamide-GDP ribazoletransferase [Pseudooceanicola algae]
MTPPDKGPSPVQDLLASLGLLSRLPLPTHVSRGGAAAWAYPLAGAILGALAGMVGLIATGIGLPAEAAALLALLTAVLLTGGLHEDGLADSADGLWGGMTVARRLEIMKDSHIGAYGTMALILGLLARWLALTALFEVGGTEGLAAMFTAGALSRAGITGLMALMPHARPDGLSRSIGPVARGTSALALGLGAVIAILLFGGDAVPAVLAGGVVLWLFARLAKAKIGGQTGDILGAGQQLAEIAVLFALIA